MFSKDHFHNIKFTLLSFPSFLFILLSWILNKRNNKHRTILVYSIPSDGRDPLYMLTGSKESKGS